MARLSGFFYLSLRPASASAASGDVMPVSPLRINWVIWLRVSWAEPAWQISRTVPAAVCLGLSLSVDVAQSSSVNSCQTQIRFCPFVCLSVAAHPLQYNYWCLHSRRFLAYRVQIPIKYFGDGRIESEQCSCTCILFTKYKRPNFSLPSPLAVGGSGLPWNTIALSSPVFTPHRTLIHAAVLAQLSLVTDKLSYHATGSSVAIGQKSVKAVWRRSKLICIIVAVLLYDRVSGLLCIAYNYNSL